jgi:hypothetical protein
LKDKSEHPEEVAAQRRPPDQSANEDSFDTAEMHLEPIEIQNIGAVTQFAWPLAGTTFQIDAAATALLYEDVLVTYFDYRETFAQSIEDIWRELQEWTGPGYLSLDGLRGSREACACDLLGSHKKRTKSVFAKDATALQVIIPPPQKKQ